MPLQKRKKGVKGQPGTPLTEYGELKNSVKMTLTPTAVKGLDELARELSISRTGLVELFSRLNQEDILPLLRKLQKSRVEPDQP